MHTHTEDNTTQHNTETEEIKEVRMNKGKSGETI